MRNIVTRGEHLQRKPKKSGPGHRTLNDYDSWKSSLRNFEWIRDVAPGATDLDLVIERRGHFLVIEDKTFKDGIFVPLGQHIALTALVAHPNFTVILQGHAESDEDKPFRWVSYGTYAPLERGAHRHFPAGLFTPADEDDMRQVVRQWIGRVNRG